MTTAAEAMPGGEKFRGGIDLQSPSCSHRIAVIGQLLGDAVLLLLLPARTATTGRHVHKTK